MPRVSVIITVKNGLPFLGKAIASVQRQTFTDWELIVLDDGSTDDTWSYLQTLQEPRLVTLRQENTGVATAKNRAIARSKGAYIAILDADDYWEPAKLEQQVAFLDQHPPCVLLGTAARIIDPEDHYLYTEGKPRDDAENRRMLEIKNAWTHSSILFRREAFDQIGGYYEPIRQYFVDYMLVYQLGQVGQMYQLPTPLVRYRIRSGSLSTKSDGRAFRELMMRSLRAGKVSAADQKKLAAIKQNERATPHFKEAVFHLFLGRTYLLHHHQPGRARSHLKKVRKLAPQLKIARLYYGLSFVPHALIHWAYRQLSPNAAYIYLEK
jgi:glycosyltransferase involved in cell wall biosynthesis